MINQKFSLTRTNCKHSGGLQSMASVQKKNWDDSGHGQNERRFFGHETRDDTGGSTNGNVYTITTDTFYVFWVGVNTSYSDPFFDGNDFV